jgi:xylan 1,4-beta-xylosidase
MILEYIKNSSGLPFEQRILENFSSELQLNPALTVSIVLSGFLSIHYNNHTRQLETHDIFFFPPFESHFFVTASEDARVLSFLIDFNFIKQLCPDVVKLSLQRRHISKNQNDELYNRLCHEFAAIVFQSMKNEASGNIKLLSYISNVVTVIFDNFGVFHDAPVEAATYTQDRITQILVYINDHFMHKISVDDIAGYLGIHPQYFSNFFKKYFHTSFTDYLTSFRINRSITSLLSSNEGILEIALDHGFSNHKTYSAAFRKLYKMSPTEFKKVRQKVEIEYQEYATNKTRDDSGAFSYLRQYLEPASIHHPTAAGPMIHQSIQLNISELSAHSRLNKQKKIISTGCAYACLRSEVQAQIREAKKDLNFDYLRIRDIFSDNLFIYYERENMPPLYNWQALDNVFDFLCSLGIKPLPEIGYMPRDLASKKQYAGWQFHPNVSFPKSLEKWCDFIEDFLNHIIERYGAKEVRSWYFDFWTAPDLELKNGYWNESQDKFFEFYKVTYEVFKKTDEQLMLGTPNFSTISGFPWYEAFFQFCYANHIYPSFVSIHLYESLMLSDSHTFLNSKSEAVVLQYQNPVNLLPDYLKQLHQIMNRNGFRSLEVIVSDWNLNFLPKDLIRDTCYMSPYMIHTILHTMDMTQALSYSAISDIHEDFFTESSLFHGGPGLMDYHGLKKSSYNALQLMYELGNTILTIGENYILTRKDKVYQLLLYNLVEFDQLYIHGDQSEMDYKYRYNIYDKMETLTVSILLSIPEGTYFVKKREVNRQYGSAFDIWAQINYPERLDKEIDSYIRSNSIPHLSYYSYECNGNLVLEEAIPPHGVILLEIISNTNRVGG